MKIFSTVKTENRADELLQSIGSTWETITECRCECGITPLINGHDNDGKLIAKVAFCECCGDDDAFIDEVVFKPNYP